MLGYKYTEEARLKMIEFLKDKENHPMFGKKHSEETKSKIIKNLSKYPLGVGIYDLNNNLLLNYSNNTELAKHLGVSKVTVSKYLNKGLIYKDFYRFKAIED